MPRKNRHDTDHARLRTRKARSEHAIHGVLSYATAVEEGLADTDEREPAAVGQR